VRRRKGFSWRLPPGGSGDIMIDYFFFFGPGFLKSPNCFVMAADSQG